MKCPKCGAENNDANNFCHECGEKLSKDSDIGKEHKIPARTQKILIVLFIVLVIICVLFALLWMHSKANEAIGQEDLSSELTDKSNEDEAIEESKGIVYDVNNLSDEQRNMLGPMDTLIYVGSEVRGTTEQWDDPSYFWGCIWFLIGNYRDLFIDSGHAITDPNLTYGVAFTEDLVKECASALFPDFTGEIPSINNIDDPGIYKEGDYYHLGIGDRGEWEGLYISSWTEYSDGSAVVEVKHMDGEGNPAKNSSTHIFELVKNQYTQSESDPIYVYTIASMTTVAGDSSYVGADAASYYILPDSNTRYYTESELSTLTKNQLRLARNEIYARHGRIFDDEELQAYFENQPWYQGTITASDFNENLLNEYEKANIKTIQAMENGASTWREAYSDYILNLEKEFENSGNHSYSLIYLDNDDIPELYIAGISEAEGDLICTVDSDGNIVECPLGRNYGMRYVEFSGKFFNWYSHFGYNELTFYKLENGEFTLIDAEPCSWNYDEEIPEDEFYEKWGDLIDFGSIVHPWDTLYSANEILSIINT